MPQCHKPHHWYLKQLFHPRNQYVGAAQSPPEKNRSPCSGVIPRSRLQKITEPSHRWKIHPSPQHKQHQDQGHPGATNINRTNDLYVPLSCPSSEIVTKYFFHCFLNSVRPPNPLNFFTCFCKSLLELLCFFWLIVQAFQIFLQVNESLKSLVVSQTA